MVKSQKHSSFSWLYQLIDDYAELDTDDATLALLTESEIFKNISNNPEEEMSNNDLIKGETIAIEITDTIKINLVVWS